MKVLAIETSCDETAAAVVEDGRHVLSSVVSSQSDIHSAFGGVVPEVASRAHLELLGPVVGEAMARAGTGPQDLAAVAATIGPGLVGSLIVGVSAAKAYAWSWDLPFVGVNHMEGHLHTAFLESFLVTADGRPAGIGRPHDAHQHGGLCRPGRLPPIGPDD